MNEVLLRELVPAVIGVLVRRGADFESAEDAVQEALVRALIVWPDDPPRDPKAWLVTAAWHRFVDDARSQSARRLREDVVQAEPVRGPVPDADDTLALYFLCAHPSLPAASAVALTLRAVGGLTDGADSARCPSRRWRSGSAAPSAAWRASRSTGRAIWRRCCACSTSCSTRATAATWTWQPRRSG